MRVGKRMDDLGTPAFTWLELKALAAYPIPGGPLWTSIVGHDWTQEKELLALNFDAAQLALWQRGGGKGRKPKPYPRPGVKGTEEVEKIGGKNPHTLEFVSAWLAERQEKT